MLAAYLSLLGVGEEGLLIRHSPREKYFSKNHHCLPHTKNKILYLPLVIINPKTLKTNIKCLELHFFLAHLTLYQNHDLILQENNVHAIPIEIASLGSHPNKQ